MNYLVTLHFSKTSPARFKVLAETATGALIKALGFDWSIEQRKAFLGARVDPWEKDTKI